MYMYGYCTLLVIRYISCCCLFVLYLCCCVLQVRAEEFSHTTFHGKAAPPIQHPPLAAPPIQPPPLAAPPIQPPPLAAPPKAALATPLAVVGKPLDPALPVKPVQPVKQGGRLVAKGYGLSTWPKHSTVIETAFACTYLLIDLLYCGLE